MYRNSFFHDPQTLEELKAQYHRLAFQHHPDKGGDVETMKAINAEYDFLHGLLKNMHKDREGTVYRQQTENQETPEAFRDMIDRLVRLPGLVVELIGSFVWVTGETKTHKEVLKEWALSGRTTSWPGILNPNGIAAAAASSMNWTKSGACTAAASFPVAPKAILYRHKRPGLSDGRPGNFRALRSSRALFWSAVSVQKGKGFRPS